MSSEEITLKPCPFCGEEAEIERYGTARVSTIVTCSGCGTSKECGEEFNHGQDWNDRTEAGIIEQLEAENKQLKKALWHEFYQQASIHGATSEKAEKYADMRIAQEALKG
jgi:hypothetical protein